jgi:hypothetical protein
VHDVDLLEGVLANVPRQSRPVRASKLNRNGLRRPYAKTKAAAPPRPKNGFPVAAPPSSERRRIFPFRLFRFWAYGFVD